MSAGFFSFRAFGGDVLLEQGINKAPRSGHPSVRQIGVNDAVSIVL